MEKKTWLKITENNDDFYQRSLMRALKTCSSLGNFIKTAQFAWIGNRSHVYKMLWATQGIRFDPPAWKDILRNRNCFI